MKKEILFLSIIVPFIQSHSQTWLKIDSLFNPSGVAVQNFSAPEFADLDSDGDSDLLIRTGSSTRVDYFRNLGGGLPPRFVRDTMVLASIYASGNTNSDYPVVCDLDGDRDLDLVISGFNGLLFYKNIGAK